MKRFEICPVVPTKNYKPLQVIGFEGAFWFEVFLFRIGLLNWFQPIQQGVIHNPTKLSCCTLFFITKSSRFFAAVVFYFLSYFF